MKTLRRFFTPSFLGEDETTHLNQTLHIILVTLLVAAGLAMVAAWLTAQSLTALRIFFSSAPIWLAVWLNRRGETHLASFLALLTMLGFATFLLWVGDGLQDIATLIYPVIIIVAGLLLRRWSFVLVTGLTFAALALVVVGG
jgi:hypothetical protein